MEEYETLGYGYRNKEDKQDFVWTNLDKKQELWLQIDYERTQ